MGLTYDAIVIGAGANGLVAAATLGRSGMRVLVVEAGGSTAGQARLHEFAPGFRVPPLRPDPGWLPPPIRSALGLEGPGLERDHPEFPLTVALGPDELFPLPRDPAAAMEVIRRHSPADAERWPDFMTRLRSLAGFLESLYQLPPPDVSARSLQDAWALFRTYRAFRRLGRRGMAELLRTIPMPVAQLAEEWFEAGPLRAAVAAGGVLDYRLGPRAGGTAFILLHHLVGAPPGTIRARGTWRTGPNAFTEAAGEVARRWSVSVRTGDAVARILVRDHAVRGVVLETGEELHARYVLSTLDPARTLLGLVDPAWLDAELLHAVRNIRFRGCTAVVLYAMDALPGKVGADDASAALAGVLSLTPDMDALERAADAVKYGEVPARPHIELTAPTLHWPWLAPEGKHIVTARVQYVPYRRRDGRPWDAAAGDALADAVGDVIEGFLPGFSNRVLARATLTPADIERRYGLTEGAISHGELALDQILFMRPVPALSRYVTPIDGLYLCGAGTHPGPGVPGGPGWLAARRLLADRR